MSEEALIAEAVGMLGYPDSESFGAVDCRNVLTALVDRVASERERLALERAAAKICTYCRDGAPIVEGGCDFYPKPEHRISFSQHVPCAASAIRGLIQEGDR